LWKASERPSYAGPLLLDTHVWVWLLNGDVRRISAPARRVLEHANAVANLFVCDISFWEVAMKAAKGQLALAVDAAVWLDRAESAPGIRYIPLDRAILVQSTRLSGELHGDPADRMLVAAAQLNGMPLMTVDAKVISYARSQAGVPVCDAR
jgi:PIN domain nuclease of toxin-antitoxin system